jgi:4-amino-4-deoxy-L-arabinose transferase-like glycosyltransferase
LKKLQFTNIGSSKGFYFYLVVAAIFLLIISPTFLSDGMFMDGMMYATISRNLAFGSGTFWQPHYTETLLPVFVNHPPLAFGLESLFFRIFGDSRFVEKFYSVVTILITSLIIVSAWKALGKKSSSGWLPIFLWFMMPTITWSAVNNMLENTMGIFICLSVFFYLKSGKSNRFLFLLLSGSMLSCGFLTKGFVTFFPLSLPFFLWLFSRQIRFRQITVDILMMAISSLIPLILIYLLLPAAREVIPKYLDITFDITLNSATKDSRFYILYKLLMDLLPAIGIMVIFLIYCRIKKIDFHILKENLSTSLSFLFLGLSGVLPIMITKVQSGYYLMTSLCFFAISFGLLIDPLIETVIGKINTSSSGFRLFRRMVIGLFITGIILTIFYSGKINRDRGKIPDMRAITAEIQENTTVNILPEMSSDWSLHAYYARYKNISLDPDLNNMHEYLIVNNSSLPDTLINMYENIYTKTNNFFLFRRKSAIGIDP